MNALTQPRVDEHPGPGEIDFSRWFMPQALTPFYHTPAYAGLADSQRLRYNQLNALYFNEQTMFFEKALARNVIGYFLAQPLPDRLHAGLRQFMAEEEQHTEMFRRLNQRCAPGRYHDRDFHFIKLPAAAARAFDFMSKRPQWFPLLVWLMHLQEERAVFFGRTFLRQADDLEPNFVAAQRKHLADEIGHVRWDEALLDSIWPRTNRLLRRFNARFLAWMIGEYFIVPKRSALRVVDALVAEFPRLRRHQPEFNRQLRALGHDAAFCSAQYSSESVPDTFKRFGDWPEFNALARVMPGYVPQMAS